MRDFVVLLKLNTVVLKRWLDMVCLDEAGSLATRFAVPAEVFVMPSPLVSVRVEKSRAMS